MNLFKKLLEFRDKSHPDHEKPFLEHLEDLRTMIYRIVITLLVSMILCFGFNNRIMAIFRRPVDKVMLTQTESTLPEKAPWIFTAESWEKARQVERSTANLTPDQRKAFFNSLDDKTLAAQAESVSLYRAALALPEKNASPSSTRWMRATIPNPKSRPCSNPSRTSRTPPKATCG